MSVSRILIAISLSALLIGCEGRDSRLLSLLNTDAQNALDSFVAMRKEKGSSIKNITVSDTKVSRGTGEIEATASIEVFYRGRDFRAQGQALFKYDAYRGWILKRVFTWHRNSYRDEIPEEWVGEIEASPTIPLWVWFVSIGVVGASVCLWFVLRAKKKAEETSIQSITAKSQGTSQPEALKREEHPLVVRDDGRPLRCRFCEYQFAPDEAMATRCPECGSTAKQGASRGSGV